MVITNVGWVDMPKDNVFITINQSISISVSKLSILKVLALMAADLIFSDGRVFKASQLAPITGV